MAPRYLPSTICQLLMGELSSSSMLCWERSSLNRRMLSIGQMSSRMTQLFPKYGEIR